MQLVVPLFMQLSLMSYYTVSNELCNKTVLPSSKQIVVNINLLHVSAPRCHHQGVVLTKEYKANTLN
jgi:hypothetical protein